MFNSDNKTEYDINGQGVISRDFAIDAPFLLNPFSLQPIEFLKVPIEIQDYKTFNDIDETNKEWIKDQVSMLYNFSEESYAEFQNNYFAPQILDETNSTNALLHGQYGLFAKQDIAQYTVLGFYSGIYVTSEEQLLYLTTQFDPLAIARYGNACVKGGIPVICGHYNGNYMTLINDWRPYGWYNLSEEALGEIKKNTYSSNTIVVRAGEYYLIAYVAHKDIKKGSEIITDYGTGYWDREKSFLVEIKKSNF